jgi:hypothetical protein
MLLRFPLPLKIKSPILIAVTLLATQSPAFLAQKSTQTAPSPVLAKDYGALPLAFEPNAGQAPPDASYIAHGDSYALLIGKSGAVLSLHQPSACKTSHAQHTSPVTRATSPAACTPTQQQLRMRLLTASQVSPATSKPTGLGLLPGKVNYLLGNDPSQWRTGIPTYSKVQLSQVYPGIDLVYYGNQRHLEYDFIVAPGANPQAIQMRFDGASPRLDSAGNLELKFKQGQVVRGKIAFNRPTLYQQTAHGRRQIPGSFRLLADSTLGFHVGAYDHTQPLIIDPVLSYSTFVTGSTIAAIAVDQQGYAYVTGIGTSISTTANAFQAVSNAGAFGGNAFVTKLDRAGQTAVYSTYIGGSGAYPAIGGPPPGGAGDGAAGIAVDTNGNAYLAGFTYSPDFPVKNPIQGTNVAAQNGNDDAFVSELNADGSALVYSTYLGGSGCGLGAGDGATGLALDATGAAYIVGTTCSLDFPTTANAFQQTIIGDTEAFIARIAPAGGSLTYATYLGGDRESYGTGIAVDSTGNAYIAGTTYSSSFPVTPGAYQKAIATPFGTNGFVTKLNPAGTAPVYSTYLGGAGATYSDPQGNRLQFGDTASAIAVDSAGSAYITGSAFSPSFPVTTGVFQPANNAPQGTSNAFVTKFNPAGTGLVYSTFLGGSGAASDATPDLTATPLGESGNAIAVDPVGNAYIAGTSASADFPVTLDAYQTVNKAYANNNTNAFFAELNPSASGLVYATYLGGSGANTYNLVDYATAVATGLPSNNTIYVAGNANSADFPITPGSYETSGQGGFVSMFSVSGQSSNVFSVAPGSLTLLSPALNQPSTVKTVTVLNVGSIAVNFTGIAISGVNGAYPFTQTNDCPARLQPNDACTIAVTFTPTVAGTLTTHLVFSYITVGDTQSGSLEIPLTGGEIVYPPNASFSPANLNFALQAIGTSSAAQTAVLKNSGQGPLNITSITLGGGGTSSDSNFSQSNNCGSAVAAGESCTFHITYTPTVLGTVNDSVSVKDNQSNSPQILGLSGSGAPPAITVAPSTLGLQSPGLNQASAAQIVTVTNNSTAAVAIQGITITGANAAEFTQTNNCGTSLAGSSTCTISVLFTPTVAGSQDATLSIADSAPGSPQTIALTGTEIVYPPNATFSPSSLTFPPQAAGTISAPQLAVLSNTGKGPLNITAITVGAGSNPDYNNPFFAETNNCGSTLASGASCTFQVTFTPQVSYGSVYGGVFVQDNQSNSPQILTLSGITGVPALTQSATSLTFPAQEVGSSSSAQTITLTNTSQVPVTLKSITPTGDFAQTTNCNGTIPVSGFCTVSVIFKPTNIGTRIGTLSITDNATGSPQSVALSGTGTAPVPAVTLAPATLSFAAQETGSTSAAQTITLTNSGYATLAISAITPTGDFAETRTCGANLAPAATCAIAVTFTPTAAGARTGMLTITDNATGSPQSVALTGTGASVTLAPAVASLTIASPGGSATDALTITSQSGFTGTVSLACTVAYKGTGTPTDLPTCALDPAQGTVAANGTLTSTLTVSTTAAQSLRRETSQPRPRRGLEIFAALLLVGFLPRRRWRKLFLLAFAIVVIGTVGGCGGSSSHAPTNPGSSTGSYQVTVTATSGTVTQTTNIPLTIN